MKVNNKIKRILDDYTHNSHAVNKNLASLLMQGKLGGTGRMIILPVDQGFEHGPDRSFAVNPDAYDPHYHFSLAVDAGLSAYAAPLGMLQCGIDKFYGKIPTILKINSSNTLSQDRNQAITASVDQAVDLGCSAIGFTIYPGSEYNFDLMEEFKELAYEAKLKGLAVVLWAYARGPEISKKGETSINIISYAAHMSALLGADIIKVKLPTDFIEDDPTKTPYANGLIDISSLSKRVAHIKKVAFNSRRIVVFSGGEAKNDDELMNEVQAIHTGGGNGSIIGRNCFQRKRSDALLLLEKMIEIYKS